MKAGDVLPDTQDQVERDGIVIRKGTVGAFLANARTWLAHDTDIEARAHAEADMIDALPSLRALGLFDVLSIRNEALRGLLEKKASDDACA